MITFTGSSKSGSSSKSIDDAIQVAAERASKTLRQPAWFEVIQTRGHLDEGQIQTIR